HRRRRPVTRNIGQPVQLAGADVGEHHITVRPGSELHRPPNRGAEPTRLRRPGDLPTRIELHGPHPQTRVVTKEIRTLVRLRIAVPGIEDTPGDTAATRPTSVKPQWGRLAHSGTERLIGITDSGRVTLPTRPTVARPRTHQVDFLVRVPADITND